MPQSGEAGFRPGWLAPRPGFSSLRGPVKNVQRQQKSLKNLILFRILWCPTSERASVGKTLLRESQPQLDPQTPQLLILLSCRSPGNRGLVSVLKTACCPLNSGATFLPPQRFLFSSPPRRLDELLLCEYRRTLASTFIGKWSFRSTTSL